MEATDALAVMGNNNNSDILHQQYGGRLMVSINEAAALLGWHPQSIRNAISKGTWATPTVKVGGKIGIAVANLVALVNGTLPTALPPAAEKIKRGRGRPKKSQPRW